MKKEKKTKEVPKMYYGAYEITNVEKDGKEKRVQIKFPEPKPTGEFSEVDGKKISIDDTHEMFTIPEWELNACSATEPCVEQEHLTVLLRRRADYVVSKIIKEFKELDVRTDDIGYYMRHLLDSMQQSEDKSTLKAFGVSEIGEVRISTWQNAGQK